MAKNIFILFSVMMLLLASPVFADDAASSAVKKRTPFHEIILEVDDFLDSTQQVEIPDDPEAKRLDVKRSDIDRPLLEDKLRIKFSEGPVESLTFFGAYQGSISANFNPQGYSTTYNHTGFIDTGAVGKFKDGVTDFKFMFNLRPQNDRTFFQNLLSDNYIATNAIPHHRILVGNSRTPIGMEGGQSSYTLPFIARSQISRNFGGIRAMGVKVIGDYDLVEYNIGGYSSDRWFQEFVPGVEFTGWVNLKPLGKTDGRYGKLVVGGGLNAGQRDTSYTVGGAYLGYEYKNLLINVEGAIADGYNGPEISTNKASGFYSTVAYKVTPRLQLLARIDQFDPNRNVTGDMRREYTAGINYYVKGQALRLILNYVFYELESEMNGSRIFFATQVLL